VGLTPSITDTTALIYESIVDRAETLQTPSEGIKPSKITFVPARPTAVVNTAHKRQISQAIPSDERPNAPKEEQEDPEAQTQAQAQAQGRNPRKSTRARKPKVLN
jgi:hypothetical protein